MIEYTDEYYKIREEIETTYPQSKIDTINCNIAISAHSKKFKHRPSGKEVDDD